MATHIGPGNNGSAAQDQAGIFLHIPVWGVVLLRLCETISCHGAPVFPVP
jgi:hypothetical protein